MLRIDGGCHCGFVTYEAEVDPERVEICHCADCQTLSGSAFRTVVPVNTESFRLLSGQPKAYVKTAESGRKRIQAFCPECGTPIYSAAAGGASEFVAIRVGTIRQRDQLPPKTQYWWRSAQAWVTELGSMRQVEKE
jgi:hypothetical protein